jgi:hypothetical protein
MMKKIVEIDAKAGLESLLGERVLFMCLNYFYVGKLIGVNRTCVLLEDASIVYETGEWGAPQWKDAQPVHRKVLYLRTGCIESFMPEKA